MKTNQAFAKRSQPPEKKLTAVARSVTNAQETVSSSTADEDETTVIKPALRRNRRQFDSDRSQTSVNGICCVCTLLCHCVTNYCLPACGVTKYQTKKYRPHDPVAAEMISRVGEHCDYIYNFFHLRLMPAVRPLLHLLYFPDSQVEADGLTVICGQVWTVTYLLRTHLSTLTPSDLHSIKHVYMQLVWESEKALRIDEIFYPVQQRFKKRILPELWTMEDKYSGSRRDFADPELREDLRPQRPFDSLYTRSDLKLKKQLQLVVISKPYALNNKSLSHEEAQTKFQELPKDKQINLMLVLLNSSVRAIVRVALCLENHVEALANEVMFTNGVKSVKCLESVELIQILLTKIWKEVHMNSQAETEIADHVCAVLDNVNNYLITSEWICDRLAEISEMVQLCYEYLRNVLKITLPKCSVIVAEADDSYKNSKIRESDVNSTEDQHHWKKTARRNFQEAKSRLLKLSSDLDSVTSKNVTQKPEHPFDSEAFQKFKDIENTFLCTEYHQLLQRIPLKIDEMSLIFI